MHESVLGSLICIIVDRVPLAFRLDRMGVLFCLINEKTLSSPALLWRITKENTHGQRYYNYRNGLLTTMRNVIVQCSSL